jgi:hypothetical protein
MTNPDAAPPSLQAFLDSFNAHDVDAVMSFFTDDCIFDMPRRDTVEVRRDPRCPLRRRPALDLRRPRHVGVDDPRDAGTGEPIEVRGCDLFEFSGGKISRKDSFWKIIDA